MVQTYFEIGKMVILEEQEGKKRAGYGKQLLKGLSKVLTKEFGKGFLVDNLENMRRFYLTYRKSETLSWISEASNSANLCVSMISTKESFTRLKLIKTIGAETEQKQKCKYNSHIINDCQK